MRVHSDTPVYMCSPASTQVYMENWGFSPVFPGVDVLDVLNAVSLCAPAFKHLAVKLGPNSQLISFINVLSFFQFVTNASYELCDFWQVWWAEFIFVYLWWCCHLSSSFRDDQVRMFSSICHPFSGVSPSICFFFMMFPPLWHFFKMSFSIISSIFYYYSDLMYNIYIWQDYSFLLINKLDWKKNFAPPGFKPINTHYDMKQTVPTPKPKNHCNIWQCIEYIQLLGWKNAHCCAMHAGHRHWGQGHARCYRCCWYPHYWKTRLLENQRW